MDTLIQSKILNLREQGVTDWRAIQDAMRKPSTTEQTVTIDRETYAQEQQLLALALKYVTQSELLNTAPHLRKGLIASALLQAVAGAVTQEQVNTTLADSLLMLTLDGQVTTSMSDPNYGQPTQSVTTLVEGASWLEANNLTEQDIPSKYEIINLIAGA